jgi:hypothetical protein
MQKPEINILDGTALSVMNFYYNCLGVIFFDLFWRGGVNRAAEQGERGSGRGNPHISRESRRGSTAVSLQALHAVREMVRSTIDTVTAVVRQRAGARREIAGGRPFQVLPTISRRT